MKKQYIIGMCLCSLLLLITGCGNSFWSCHERCMDIELLKLDNTCESLFADSKDVTDKCNITWTQVINYKSECFDICTKID